MSPEQAAHKIAQYFWGNTVSASAQFDEENFLEIIRSVRRAALLEAAELVRNVDRLPNTVIADRLRDRASSWMS